MPNIALLLTFLSSWHFNSAQCLFTPLSGATLYSPEILAAYRNHLGGDFKSPIVQITLQDNWIRTSKGGIQASVVYKAPSVNSSVWVGLQTTAGEASPNLSIFLTPSGSVSVSLNCLFYQDHRHSVPSPISLIPIVKSPASSPMHPRSFFLQTKGSLCHRSFSYPLSSLGPDLACCLPEPSPLASSGSSWRLSFHSKGASQGVTVTDNGVLSSSTTKKYLWGSGPIQTEVIRARTYNQESLEKSLVLFLFI